jgi:type II secretory pathway pseudopilin PulG
MSNNQAARRRRSRHKRGRFGLTDLMAVLLIFGVVTASAVPGFNRFMRSLDLNKQVQRVATMLRVVRQKAITDNRVYVVWWSDADNQWGFWDDEQGWKTRLGEVIGVVTLPTWLRSIAPARTPSPPIPGSSPRKRKRIREPELLNSDGYTRSPSAVD